MDDRCLSEYYITYSIGVEPAETRGDIINVNLIFIKLLLRLAELSRLINRPRSGL